MSGGHALGDAREGGLALAVHGCGALGGGVPTLSWLTVEVGTIGARTTSGGLSGSILLRALTRPIVLACPIALVNVPTNANCTALERKQVARCAAVKSPFCRK